jgi:HSP20 family protein
MNRMFEDFFNQPFGLPLQRVRTQATVVVPALDVKEDENSVVVTAELPGIDRNDVEISVQDDMLEIRGQKSEEQKREEENYCMVERSYGSFSRRIVLPAEVDSEHAEATMQNGVLTLRMPKASPKAGKKTITIQESTQREAMGEARPEQMSAGQASSGQASERQSSTRQSTSSQASQQQQTNP